MIRKIAEFVKKYGLALGVVAMAVLVGVNLFFLPPVSPAQPIPADIPKLSEIKGPSIDGDGASISCEEDAACPLPSRVAVCATLPAKLWILLLAAYLFLLIFNLGYTFGKRETVQWFWEALYTLLALGAWFYFDQCQANLWYPLYVLTLGILIYLFYLYFFWENHKQAPQNPE